MIQISISVPSLSRKCNVIFSFLLLCIRLTPSSWLVKMSKLHRLKFLRKRVRHSYPHWVELVDCKGVRARAQHRSIDEIVNQWHRKSGPWHRRHDRDHDEGLGWGRGGGWVGREGWVDYVKREREGTWGIQDVSVCMCVYVVGEKGHYDKWPLMCNKQWLLFFMYTCVDWSRQWYSSSHNSR